MKIIANGQEHELEEGKRFTCLIHQQGIRIDVPEAVEINARNTIDCMAKMNQRQWEHISGGQLFKFLFSTAFPKEDYPGQKNEEPQEFNFPKPQTRFEVDVPATADITEHYGPGKPPKTRRWILDLEAGIPIPATIEELNKGDFGVIHIAGMITLGCEAIFEGKTKIFFRNPEDNLHPKTEQRIVDMMMKMMYLAGFTGSVQEESLAGATAGIGANLPVDTPEPKKKPTKKKPAVKKKPAAKKKPRKKKDK